MKHIFVLSLLIISALILNGCDQVGGSNDSIPPTITLYSPFSDSSYAYGSQPVYYEAYDDQGLGYIELWVNNIFQKNYPVVNGVSPSIFWNIDSSLIGKRVSFFLKVFDMGGNSATSLVKSNILIVQTKDKPTAPYNFTLKKVSNNIINLTWKDSSKGIISYELYRSETIPATDASYGLINSLPANAFNVNDVIPSSGLTYSYKIKSYNIVGASPFSAVVSSSGASGIELTAEARGTHEVYLSWKTTSSNANYYNIERKSSSSSFFQYIDSKGPGSVDYTDVSGGLYTGGSFTYRVKAFTSTDSSTSNESSITTWPLDLDPPSGGAAIMYDSLVSPGNTTRMIKVTWSDNTNQETQNIVERKLGSGSFAVVKILGSDNVTYFDSDFIKGQQYTYRIRAAKPPYYSKYSSEFSIVPN